MTKFEGAIKVLSILMMAGSMTIITHQWSAAHGWKAPPDAAKAPNPVAKEKHSIQRGKDIYQQNCIACHGNSARGDGPLANALNPKPSNLIHRAKMHSEGDFFWKISEGRSPMPAFKNKLKEREIWDVINHIKSLETGK